MRVLVTGGAGFIGRSVVRRLLTDGHDVTAALSNPGRSPLPSPVTAVRSDLSDRAELREVLSASDGVTYWASCERAGRELGWRPDPLEEGVRRAWA